MSLVHSSKRRPPPLQPADYDHEISLVDTTLSDHSQSRSASRTDSARRDSGAPLRKRDAVHNELSRRKYKKYQARAPGQEINVESGEESSSVPGSHEILEGEERGRKKATDTGTKRQAQQETDSAIDILYENQRGGFLCGFALFGGKALGSLDPAPWTNIAQKTSATDIHNAQVPDPTWEWLWKEWVVNHSDKVDNDGWEYSFAFAKMFSWHGPSWWNSCVRRRVWIRKRIKKHPGHTVNQAHMLNPDYFTIHSARDRSRSRTSSNVQRLSLLSARAQHELEEETISNDITDIGSLLKALRIARIDREKTEAVRNFIKNGGEDLFYLKEQMHEIMRMFIFQASRRSLLTHLLTVFMEASDEKEHLEHDETVRTRSMKRLENLEAALKAADEEVKKLEYWSDVKEIAEDGLSKGAVDDDQGWNSKKWQGIDDSGPKDVLSNKNLPGLDECEKDNEKSIVDDKGKSKA